MLRPTIANLLMVTLLAVVGIYGLKAITRAVPVPGLTAFVGAV